MTKQMLWGRLRDNWITAIVFLICGNRLGGWRTIDQWAWFRNLGFSSPRFPASLVRSFLGQRGVMCQFSGPVFILLSQKESLEILSAVLSYPLAYFLCFSVEQFWCPRHFMAMRSWFGLNHTIVILFQLFSIIRPRLRQVRIDQ